MQPENKLTQLHGQYASHTSVPPYSKGYPYHGTPGQLPGIPARKQKRQATLVTECPWLATIGVAGWVLASCRPWPTLNWLNVLALLTDLFHLTPGLFLGVRVACCLLKRCERPLIVFEVQPHSPQVKPDSAV